jgi:hypothetical protein
MRTHLLVEDRMLPIPANITIEANWGRASVIVPSSHSITYGEHMLVEGSEDAIKDWLRPFDGIWVGEGHPMEQRFSVCHIPA